MTTARHNTQIVGQGLARLTSAFITKPNVRAWLAVLLRPWQQIEDATWDVMFGRQLADAVCYVLPVQNAVFDVLGRLVGIKRLGAESDVRFKARIYLAAACNRSTGRTTDWAGIAKVLAPWCDATYYLDGQAAVWFGAWNLGLAPVPVAAQLAKVPGNGIGGLFAWSTWPEGDDFSCSSVYDSTAGEAGWGSIYDSTVGGVLVAGSEI